MKVDIQRHMIIYCAETLTFFVFFGCFKHNLCTKKYSLYSVHMYVQIMFTSALRPHTFDPLCDEREKCKLQGNIDHFSLLTECGFTCTPEKVWVPSLYRHEYTNCGAKLQKVTDCFRGSFDMPDCFRGSQGVPELILFLMNSKNHFN